MTTGAAHRLSTCGGVTSESLWDMSKLDPKLVSLPVSMPDPAHAEIAVSFAKAISLNPGESFHTFRTFVAVHQGDYFHTLIDYRRFMMKQGFQMATAPDDAFGAIWCAWGYGRTVQPKQVYDTLPTAKRLGFRWVTLDGRLAKQRRRLAT